MTCTREVILSSFDPLLSHCSYRPLLTAAPGNRDESDDDDVSEVGETQRPYDTNVEGNNVAEEKDGDAEPMAVDNADADVQC